MIKVMAFFLGTTFAFFLSAGSFKATDADRWLVFGVSLAVLVLLTVAAIAYVIGREDR